MADDYTERGPVFTERKEGRMTGVARASELLDEMAEVWPRRLSFKALVGRATEAVNKAGRSAGYLKDNIKHSRIEDLWRQEARRIDAEELDAIRAAHDALILRKARDRHQELINRIERLEAALRLSDADAHRALFGGLRELAGRKDSAVDQAGA